MPRRQALFEIRLELWDRLRFPFPLDRQPADDLLILRAQLLDLGEQRNVLFAEDLGVGAESLDGRLEPGSRVAELDEALRESHTLLVRLREDLHREPQVSLLLLGVSGVARGVPEKRRHYLRLRFSHSSTLSRDSGATASSS